MAEYKIIFIGTIGSSAVNFRGSLLRRLVAKQCSVYVFLSSCAAEDRKQLEDWGVIVRLYKLSRSGLNPISELSTFLQLVRLIREVKPHAVFSFFVKPVIYGSLAAWYVGVPKRVAMLEGLGFAFTTQPTGVRLRTQLIKWFQVHLYRQSLPRCHHVIFLNFDDKYDLLDSYRIPVSNPIILGPIGVDLNFYSPTALPLNELRFLFVGRLLAEKGVHIFLDAAQKAKARRPEIKFDVVGSPDTTSPNALSETQLHQHVKSKLITFGGQVSDIRPWIDRCSAFVLPSFREGFPRSTQEAMAMGRAVITTDVPGCRSSIEEGRNGFIVPPFDSDALAEKMIWFADNPSALQAMGDESRKIAIERFDIQKINCRVTELLLENEKDF